jgi:hypothetical protein
VPIVDVLSLSRQLRSGNSEVLGEQKHAPEIWAQPVTRAIAHLINEVDPERATAGVVS